MVDTREGLSAPVINRLPIGRVVSATFTTFGRAPAFFLVCSLVVAVPGIFRLALLGSAAQAFNLSAVVVGVLNFLLAYFFQAAMTYVAARLQDGPDFDTGDAFRVAGRRFFILVAAGILVTLAVTVGSALLLVPGLILLCMFAVTVPACVLEPVGPIDGMTRSRLLTKGSRWRILGLYGIFFLPLIVVSLLNSLVLIRLGHVVVGLSLNAAISVFWTPIATIFGVVMYVELRRLKNHIGVATVFD